MKKHPLLLPCLLLASALTACGGGGDGGQGASEGGGDERAQIVAAIESLETEPSASDCEKLETKAFVEQATHSSGKAAMEECEELADVGKPPDSLEVSQVAVSGRSATATVALSNGDLNDRAVVISLLKEDGRWKLDRIVRFAKIDRAAIQRTVEKVLRAYKADPEQSECISKRLSYLSTEAFERFLLESDAQQITKMAKSCLG